MRTHKVYKEDAARIAANRATAFERAEWNRYVERHKKVKDAANRAAFVPRKASHKSASRLSLPLF